MAFFYCFQVSGCLNRTLFFFFLQTTNMARHRRRHSDLIWPDRMQRVKVCSINSCLRIPWQLLVALNTDLTDRILLTGTRENSQPVPVLPYYASAECRTQPRTAQTRWLPDWERLFTLLFSHHVWSWPQGQGIIWMLCTQKRIYYLRKKLVWRQRSQRYFRY